MTVLITGGTGSFGKALNSTAWHLREAVAALCSGQGKHYVYGAGISISSEKPIRYFIGDVRDVDRLGFGNCGWLYWSTQPRHIADIGIPIFDVWSSSMVLSIQRLASG